MQQRSAWLAHDPLALVVHHPPEVVLDLVDLPNTPSRYQRQRDERIWPTRFRRISAANMGPKTLLPEPDRLMADLDPALMQQVLHVPGKRGTRTYGITARRITSSEVVKDRNGLDRVMPRKVPEPLPGPS